MVFETYVYPFGYFLALYIVKLMKFECPFTLGSYDIAYLRTAKFLRSTAKFLCIFPNFLTDFVDWNAEKGQQGKNVLSSMPREEKR